MDQPLPRIKSTVTRVPTPSLHRDARTYIPKSHREQHFTSHRCPDESCRLLFKSWRMLRRHCYKKHHLTYRNHRWNLQHTWAVKQELPDPQQTTSHSRHHHQRRSHTRRRRDHVSTSTQTDDVVLTLSRLPSPLKIRGKRTIYPFVLSEALCTTTVPYADILTAICKDKLISLSHPKGTSDTVTIHESFMSTRSSTVAQSGTSSVPQKRHHKSKVQTITTLTEAASTSSLRVLGDNNTQSEIVKQYLDDRSDRLVNLDWSPTIAIGQETGTIFDKDVVEMVFDVQANIISKHGINMFQ